MNPVKRYPHPEPSNYKDWKTWAKKEVPILADYLLKNAGSAVDVAALTIDLNALTILVDSLLVQYSLITTTTTGSSTLANGNFKNWEYQIDLASGSSTYIYTLNLSNTDRIAGDTIEVNLINIGNTNVTLKFIDTATATTLLNLTFTSDFVTRVNMPILLKFHWNGASWDLDFCDE